MNRACGFQMLALSVRTVVHIVQFDSAWRIQNRTLELKFAGSTQSILVATQLAA